MKKISNILLWIVVPYVKLYIVLINKGTNKILSLSLAILVFCMWMCMINTGNRENKVMAEKPQQSGTLIIQQTQKPTEVKTPKPTPSELDKRKAWLKDQQFEDGSYNLVRYAVKQSMKNPDSFKHVQTFTDNNNLFDVNEQNPEIIVTMKYRGTNSFNAVVTEEIKIKIKYPNMEMDVVK